jgi:hypothetical protein
MADKTNNEPGGPDDHSDQHAFPAFAAVRLHILREAGALTEPSDYLEPVRSPKPEHIVSTETPCHEEREERDLEKKDGYRADQIHLNSRGCVEWNIY